MDELDAHAVLGALLGQRHRVVPGRWQVARLRHAQDLGLDGVVRPLHREHGGVVMRSRSAALHIVVVGGCHLSFPLVLPPLSPLRNELLAHSVLGAARLVGRSVQAVVVARRRRLGGPRLLQPLAYGKLAARRGEASMQAMIVAGGRQLRRLSKSVRGGELRYPVPNAELGAVRLASHGVLPRTRHVGSVLVHRRQTRANCDLRPIVASVNGRLVRARAGLLRGNALLRTGHRLSKNGELGAVVPAGRSVRPGTRPLRRRRGGQPCGNAEARAALLGRQPVVAGAGLVLRFVRQRQRTDAKLGAAGCRWHLIVPRPHAVVS
mmetsp:Transcript_46565/g.116443  ORF Transcript_46565/g.116443 Transcript_46565/m.116443 type:complete len:321 (-) Transcript_46565:1055-2017(-)